MKREIKFRAWDNVNKQWLCGYKLLGGFSLFGECVAFGAWNDVLSNMINGMYGEGGEHLIVEQFTGLKDKNGVDIYEGDRLRITDLDLKDCIREDLSVYYFKGSFCITFLFDSLPLELSCLKSKNIEVIGNIHEK